ncbi:MAG: hypothetical protein WCD54_00270 [Pseudolabrys sp.]
MEAFLLACVAAVIIAIIGGVILNSIQEPEVKFPFPAPKSALVQ